MFLGLKDADYLIDRENTNLPSTSRFQNLNQAQSFLTEVYTAFGALRSNGTVEVVRIQRCPWKSAGVVDSIGHYEAMTSGELFKESEAQLDSILYVENLEYYWKRLGLKMLK